MEGRIKVLITSVGSLVGQNILDVLEYQGFSRRHMLEIVGTNSIASSPNNYRCDRCYLMPATSDPTFHDRIIDIIQEEQPALILNGRDEDTELIARILADNPDFNARTPYGNVETLKIARDKYHTWLFCQRNQLPFADSFVRGVSGDKDEMTRFVNNNGFPLIAKPITGFASKGVFFVRNWQDMDSLWDKPGYMFQEYLGDPDILNGYFQQMSGMVPLFAHAPNIFHHSCHTVISPQGAIDRIFISRNDHQSGVTMGFQRVFDEELAYLAESFAKAIYAEGGYGPLTVQFRKSRQGQWKAQEINMRTNGNTFPRFLMGQDDIGLIFKGVLPELQFPIYEAAEESHAYVIGKILTSFVMHPHHISELNSKGIVSY